MKTLFSFLLLSSLAFAEMNPFSMPMDTGAKEIVIKNRILLKVGGKSISVYDVVKKMDLLFYRQYPQYASQPELRYQYYKVNWKSMLDTVIDDQLILADAKEKKVEVTDGDIREMMEELFGPDVVMSLDKLGLSFEEARELIRTELIVRKMMGMMVRAKAQSEVSPQDVRKLFEKVVNKAPLDEKWVYQMLTIESKEEGKSKTLADTALEMLSGQKVAFEELPELLKQKENDVQVRLSEVYKRADRELSSQHKNVLESMGIGAVSHPIVQESKKEGSHIVRIFHLKEREKAKEPALSEFQEKLHGELLEKAIEKNIAAYSGKLRNHYGITENYIETMIPAHFEPFALR